MKEDVTSVQLMRYPLS